MTEKKYYPWLLVLVYSMLGIFCPAAVTQFSMVVDDLAKALQVDQQIVLQADTCRAVCLVIAMFLSSYIYRRLGLRKTIALGLAFQALPQFIIPFAVSINSIPLFFIAKASQGLNAIAFPLYISAITMWIDKRYYALSTAIFNGSFTAGAGVGAWISGRIVPAMGWRSSFYIIGIMVVICSVPVLLLTRDRTVQNPAEPEIKHRGVYTNIVRNPVTWMCVFALLANTWVTQAVTVDMSVYSKSLNYSYSSIGNMMLIISAVTVISSIIAGAVSDAAAARSKNKIRARSIVMGAGYALSAAAAALIAPMAGVSFMALEITACMMMFGASWAIGVFWALPSEIYDPSDSVAGVAFCSGASNIPNPIASAVVGVVLGTRGYWGAAWMTCAATSVISLIASIMLSKQKAVSLSADSEGNR